MGGSEASEKTAGERRHVFLGHLLPLWHSFELPPLAHDPPCTCACFFGRHLVRQVVGMFEKGCSQHLALDSEQEVGTAVAEEPVGSVFAVDRYSNQMRRVSFFLFFLSLLILKKQVVNVFPTTGSFIVFSRLYIVPSKSYLYGLRLVWFMFYQSDIGFSPEND